MCDPVAGLAIATFVIGAGSEIAGARAQGKAAKETRKAAIESAHQTWTDLGFEQAEAIEAEFLDTLQVTGAATQARSEARVAAGEGGVAGTSVETLLTDFDRKASEYATQSGRNLDRTLAQLQREKQGADRLRARRIKAARGPNPFAVALRIGGKVLGAGPDVARGFGLIT